MKKGLFFTVLLIFSLALRGQISTQNQQQLEAQRLRLQQEIKQINSHLFSNTKKRKNVVAEVEDLEVKLNVRESLIKVTNQQANMLNKRIRVNERSISTQRKALEDLRADYAQMIQKSYASKSLQNRLMFLFSSENFVQAYKRIQYLKQYASYRRKQAAAISSKTQLLQALNKTLFEQKQKKEALIAENRQIQQQLEKERQQQQSLIQSLRNKERSLSAQINQKEKESKALEREINRLIEAAIAASNKASGAKGSTAFVLTPEAKLLAANFQANKGRLPWPLEKGVVVQGFGRQPHPVVKTTVIQSNGVTIATSPNAVVRSVFEGEVMSVVTFKGSNPSVLIRHGNYITAYKNLGKLFVKKGDKVAAKQAIGEVFTNQNTGKTLLQFSLYNNTKAQNPKDWIYQM